MPRPWLRHVCRPACLTIRKKKLTDPVFSYCQAPDGDEVEISLAGEEADSDDDSGDAGGENCHFHAGVE